MRLGTSPRVVLVVMCVGYFLVLLDVTAVNVALPKIDSGLHAGVSGLQWVVDGYALALASLMLVGGTVGDLHGHKRVVLWGLAVFGAGSLACGIAPSAASLVAARVAQGVGAALLLPGTLAIISHTFPGRAQQARAIGVWAGIGSLALPAGPLLGGLLIEGFGWRGIFLVNVPIVVVSLLATTRLVQESSDPQGRRVDVAGVTLGMLLLAAITLAFIERTLVAAFAALPLLAVFVLVERRRGRAAMLPLELFRRPTFSVANAAAAVMNFGALGTIFVLTLFLQSVQGHSPLVAGLAVVPLFAPLAAIAPFAGRLTSRIGPRWPTACGFVLAAGGLMILLAAQRASSYLVLLPAFLLWGIGLALITPAVVAAAIAAVPAARAGLASAINNTARQAGGAIGIAVAGAVAGRPTAGGFVTGFHVVAAGAAGLYLVAALSAGVLIPGVGFEPTRP
jgi:DHA2 family methylenomycin A resistance protein-like MFS transporter